MLENVDLNVHKYANKPGTSKKGERFQIICMWEPVFLSRMIKWYPSQRVTPTPTIPCTGNCCIAFGRYCSDARRFYKWKEKGTTWTKKVCRDRHYLIAHCCIWFTGQEGASLVHKSLGAIYHFLLAWMEKSFCKYLYYRALEFMIHLAGLFILVIHCRSCYLHCQLNGTSHYW